MSEPTAPTNGGFQKSHTLGNRTFIGLLIAQFLAAFNDQAIHASGMFFAINKKALTEQTAISLMPILFFAPWAIFSTLAGYYADKYSKRFSLIFWKIAEIGITFLALLGFVLGGDRFAMPNLGVGIVLFTVFLMGMHSTFFVPAKYGAMPEILRDDMLSKGNGLLESLSFLATILGTVCGGLMSFYFHGSEYLIGVILLVLAIIGAAASFMIRRMPAANSTRPFPEWVYKPLWQNLRTLMKSHPLTYVLVGIAFFTFMLAFMRAAVYMLGESRIPRWTELKTSGIVGMTALGIGLGSPAAGWLSGRKVELGLVLIGGIGMIVVICLAALLLNSLMGLVVCIILIGFFTGFYLVPLFTQQQHRAPKKMKGDIIATCNFTNVVGAIAASLLFFGLVWAAHQLELAPQVKQEDKYTERTLTVLQEDIHHRPAFVQVARKDAEGNIIGRTNIGKPTKPGEVPALVDNDAVQKQIDDVIKFLGAFGDPPNKEDEEEMKHLAKAPAKEDEQPPERDLQVVLSQKALSAWNQSAQARKVGERPPDVVVSVSRYVIESVDAEGRRITYPHYYVRLSKFKDMETEPLPAIYDNQELPRYLFLGAGAMTLGVLLILLWLLPDMPRRSLWVLKSLGKTRLRVSGIQNLPGYGPVVLASNAKTREDIDNVKFASDRMVHYYRAADDPSAATAKLKHEHVVGLTVSDIDSSLLDKIRQSPIDHLTIVPVSCEAAHVHFGKPLPGNASTAQILEGIRGASGIEEH